MQESLARALHQYEALKGGPGVLKYQQRMAFMWEQVNSFESMAN